MAFDSLAYQKTSKSTIIEHSPRDNIPSPPALPLIGNLLDIQNEVPIKGIEHIIDLYGPIVKLNLGGNEQIFIGSAELLEELCDEKRFWKSTSDGVAALGGGKNPNAPRSYSGLFTSPSEDGIDWQQAHRTLMPAFGPLSIQEMFDEMHDIGSQLVLKWARMGPGWRIPVTSDFTRLTLDTIALCAMGYRFNSFYQDDMHPFVKAMNNTLLASSERNNVGSIIRKIMPWDNSAEKLKLDRQYMRELSHELVQNRRDNPTEKRDLLNVMIDGKDPKTGEKMPDGLISANMITFLIAGHETTSGLLSFAFTHLLQNPESYFKAQQEVDRVLGRGKMKVEHLKELKYIDAVLRETLRLSPTVPAFSRGIRTDNPNDVEYLAGGKYAINKNDRVLCMITKCQRDPKVFGEDANEFRPERMLEENFHRMPKGVWKPFGTGVRGCIGRAFAWQEAQMASALLLQNFNFRLDDPSYQLKIKQTLTVKPEGFHMRATLREGITAGSLQATLSSSGDAVQAAVGISGERHDSASTKALVPMTILYGSNTGTCMSLAQKLNVDARRRGFAASVMEMDAAVGTLPKDQPVVIITSSYEGQPPDNAGQFVSWLETAVKEESLQGVHYAVFGCGHRDWSSTFQRVPTLVDDLITKHGAKRVASRGLSDAADGDMFSDFDTWTQALWSIVAPDSEMEQSSPGLELELSTQDRSSHLRQDVQAATVVDARSLTAPGEPARRHLEIKLPAGMAYTAGDYLAILPVNPSESVTRVQKHFKIAHNATMTIMAGAATFLPTGVSMSVADLLKDFVELSQPVTKRDVRACIEACTSSADRGKLSDLEEHHSTEVAEKKFSLLDLLEKYSSINMSFGSFISTLPPLRARHYSISSSPLANSETCTITYGIIDEAAKSGIGQYLGVTGAYLSHLKAGDEILVSVKATNKYFHLPADPDTTPIIMFGAGTGIAPFRGFIQERAQQIAAGRQLAPALMFMGCQYATKDRLYAEEMDAWAKAGAVDLRYAFSREPEHSGGSQYIGDRLLKDREDIRRLWHQGAKVFTCGSPAVSANVGHAAMQMLMEIKRHAGTSITEEEAADWFKERRNERFVVDVFA